MAPITIYEALAVTLAGFAAFIVFVSALNGPSFSRTKLPDSTTAMPTSSSSTRSVNSSLLTTVSPTTSFRSIDDSADCIHNVIRWAPTRQQFHDGFHGSKAFYRPPVPSDISCTFGSHRSDPVSAFCRLNYHHIKRVQFSAIATLVLSMLANACACLHVWGCCRGAAPSFLLNRVVFWVTIVAAAFALQVRGRLGDWDLDATSVSNETAIVCAGTYEPHGGVVNLWVVGACLLLPLLWTILRDPVDYSFSHLGRDRQRRRRQRNNEYVESNDSDSEDGDVLPSYSSAIARLWRRDPECGRTDLPSYGEVQPVPYVLDLGSDKVSLSSDHSRGQQTGPGSVVTFTTVEASSLQRPQFTVPLSHLPTEHASQQSEGLIEQASSEHTHLENIPMAPASAMPETRPSVELRILNTSIV
eukprot:m.224479 g.224479  ORF g.224479 m.224479 type:complete len:414 (-) comp17290_c0_seq5:73-1314(-)